MSPNNTFEYYLTIMREIFFMYNPNDEELLQIQENNTTNEQGIQELQIQKFLVVYLMVSNYNRCIINANVMVERCRNI